MDGRGVKVLKDLNFHVRAGEIVGLAGVAGNGQSELLEVLAGMTEATSGEMRYKDLDLVRRKYREPKPRPCANWASRTCRKTVRAKVWSRRFRLMKMRFWVISATAVSVRGRCIAAGRWLPVPLQLIKQFDIRPDNPLMRVGLIVWR